jgi:hypothetical protein
LNSLTTCAEWKERAQRLEQIVVDFHWMARRYADGRQSYATSTFNRDTRSLLAMNIQLNPCAEGTIWARDGMGPQYGGLTEEEHNLGEPLDSWSKVVYSEEYTQLRMENLKLQAALERAREHFRREMDPLSEPVREIDQVLKGGA